MSRLTTPYTTNYLHIEIKVAVRLLVLFKLVRAKGDRDLSDFLWRIVFQFGLKIFATAVMRSWATGGLKK